jgi:hypothetical protein
VAGPSGAGVGGRKAPSSMGETSPAEVLRLRATSAVSRNRSARRFAQDDGFVGVSTENILNKLALMGRSPGHLLNRSPSPARPRTDRPGKLSAVPPGLDVLSMVHSALRAGLLSAVPPGLNFRTDRVLTQTLKDIIICPVDVLAKARTYPAATFSAASLSGRSD